MTSRTVKAIACWTAGLMLTVTGVLGAVGGILTNANAPECSFLNGPTCDVQRDLLTTMGTSYIIGGIVFAVVGLALFGIASPWLAELDEGEKATEPSES